MINISHITKEYVHGKKAVIRPINNFNMSIQLGETIILNGPSGCGKSTLLSIMAGLLKPTTGFVEINGKNISKLPEHFAAEFRRENIGMIFQQFNLIEKMSVIDNVSVPLIPSGVHFKEIHRKAAEVLEKLDMLDKLNIYVEKLSGGEMQRTAIARALITKPDIILADEPTANLDAALTNELLAIFKSLKNEGKTLIIATHDEAVANSGLADKVIQMTKDA